MPKRSICLRTVSQASATGEVPCQFECPAIKELPVRTVRELAYLARDFTRVLTGTDYFHRLQPIGLFLADERCYYNDLRGKALWSGAYLDSVPAVYWPQLQKIASGPVLVLQYGLASMDCYSTTGDRTFLTNIGNVANWVLKNLSDRNYCPNGLISRDPSGGYISDNSAMSQGELLSFCVRAIHHDLVNPKTATALDARLPGILENMLAPVEEEGTALRKGHELFLCEYCTYDGNVVLNGWIFAIFGLLDYLRWRHHDEVREALRQTLATLVNWLPVFTCDNGWSFYDTNKRVSSPFYHHLHIQLLRALYHLRGREDFEKAAQTFERAYTYRNRVRYTLRKIIDKLGDKEAYTTQS